MATTYQSRRTTDHDEIREWVENRNGRPAIVESTWDGDSAVLRIDFSERDESLMEVSWDEFFRIFDENDLAFLYQEETTDGETSRFFKLVERSEDDDDKDDDKDEEDKDEVKTEEVSN